MTIITICLFYAPEEARVLILKSLHFKILPRNKHLATFLEPFLREINSNTDNYVRIISTARIIARDLWRFACLISCLKQDCY